MDFGRVEAEFGKLKAQFEQGGLTEEELKAQLQELMIEDEQGRWWIIGYETGQWYVHDGEQWVQQEPPRIAPNPPPARPQYPGVTELASDSQPGPTPSAPSRPLLGLRLKRDTVSVLLITAGWLVLWGIIGERYRLEPPYSPDPGFLFVLAFGGLIGGLVTGLALRRTDPPSPWKQVPAVAVGWGLGWGLGWGVAGATVYQWLLSGAVGGLVGGLITALALRWTHPSIRWKHVTLVALGWGISWAVGGSIGWSIPVTSLLVIVVKYALWAGIGAGAGSWFMFRQLREATQSPSQ